jgi:hypothetical protein
VTCDDALSILAPPKVRSLSNGIPVSSDQHSTAGMSFRLARGISFGFKFDTSSLFPLGSLGERSSRPLRDKTGQEFFVPRTQHQPAEYVTTLEYLRPVGTLFSHHSNCPGPCVLEFSRTARNYPWYLPMTADLQLHIQSRTPFTINHDAIDHIEFNESFKTYSAIGQP